MRHLSRSVHAYIGGATFSRVTSAEAGEGAEERYTAGDGGRIETHVQKALPTARDLFFSLRVYEMTRAVPVAFVRKRGHRSSGDRQGQQRAGRRYPRVWGRERRRWSNHRAWSNHQGEKERVFQPR